MEIIMDIDYNDYWNPEYFVDNIETNKKNVENTINDLSISEKK